MLSPILYCSIPNDCYFPSTCLNVLDNLFGQVRAGSVTAFYFFTLPLNFPVLSFHPCIHPFIHPFACPLIYQAIPDWSIHLSMAPLDRLHPKSISPLFWSTDYTHGRRTERSRVQSSSRLRVHKEYREVEVIQICYFSKRFKNCSSAAIRGSTCRLSTWCLMEP